MYEEVIDKGDDVGALGETNLNTMHLTVHVGGRGRTVN